MSSAAALHLTLLCLAASSAAARRLQQQAPAAVGAAQPVQLSGDSSARVLTRKHFTAQGGAYAALGRPALLQLKRGSRFVGSVEDLAARLDKEKDLGVDAVNTKLLYQCKGLAANVSATELASGTAPSAVDPTLTAAQAFSLSSRPSATKKIFLDFDGHTTTGSNWNALVGADPIVTPPYDKDGSPATWSADELSDIVAIWRAVAEDYAMFDVDVTTADPGAAALTGNGVRVAIGGSYMDWYRNTAGGVAYVGSFGMANTPCFIFTKNLGPNYAKYVWEAVSHEVGHTLGLYHDGVTGVTSYYSGQGDWAPIMGTGYYKPLTTFDKGEYAGSNNQQDDVAVMSGFLPLIAQENGNSLASATPLGATVDAATGLASAKATGVITGPAASEVFSFQAAAGSATLSAAVTAPWAGSANRANLDVQLSLLDASGALLATINPAGTDPTNGLGVAPTAVALPAAGTYYVAVSGAGSGDKTATGYSAYGIRGAFELRAGYAPMQAQVQPSPAPVQVQPSPSPSPVLVQVQPSPSPSPDVQPSPSPAPVQPSPSPAPVQPSPSPAPAPAQAMRVSSISMARAPAGGGRSYCTATVYLKDAANVAVTGARLNGAWSSSPAQAVYAAATATVYTNAAGSISFRSPAILKNAGLFCVFSVSDISLPGYYFDTISSLMSRRLPV